jgi:D-psicose/D-tagatose/L-ribulose 3-epimerase
MKLAVSQIAWTPAENDAAHTLMRSKGIELIELVPSRKWPDPRLESNGASERWRLELEQQGLRPVALQALLFGRPELKVFESDTARPCIDYLKAIIRLAAGLGPVALVFGSPRNRFRGNLPLDEARRRAISFFSELGEYSARHGVKLCLEPNPPAYGCDFLTTAREVMSFVRETKTPGLFLQLDVGALSMNGEDPSTIVSDAGKLIGHTHASEPHLAPFGQPVGPHAAVARALKNVGYDGAVSLEMKSNGLEALETAVDYLAEIYA